MVAYRLPSNTREGAILKGQRDVLLATPRARDLPGGHPGPGGRMHMRIAGAGGAPERHLPKARVVFTARVSFSVDGVVRILHHETAHPGTVEGVHALLAQAEQGSPGGRAIAADAFARRAGFDDYAAQWRSIASSRADVVTRVVLAWEALS
ncbi:MAG: hypothetical protein ACK4Z5_03290 [Brevundimonas sp.]